MIFNDLIVYTVDITFMVLCNNYYLAFLPHVKTALVWRGSYSLLR